jgi:hypothetical protein
MYCSTCTAPRCVPNIVHAYINLSEMPNPRKNPLVAGGQAPMCICSHYLNVIFDIFWNVKKIQTKNSQVRLHMLCVYKVVLRKTNLSFGLRKKRQILMLKRRHCIIHVLSFLYRPGAMSFFRKTFTNTYGLWRCTCEIFRLNFLTLRNIIF